MKKIKLISICFAASLFLSSCTTTNSNISNEEPKDQSFLAYQKKAIYEVSRGKRVDRSQLPGPGELKAVDILKVEKPKVTITKAEEPKTKESIAEVPTTEVPNAKISIAEAPKAEVPKAEVPKAEVPKAEVPNVEIPKAEVPRAELPKAELPKAEAPKAPIAEQPKQEAVKDQESAKPVEKQNDLVDTIKITGSNSFVKQVQEALNLLKQKDLEAYNKVNKYLSKIVENENSGVDVYSKTFFLGKGTVSTSDAFWLAGVIVHDAYHSELYSLNKPFTGAEAEKACNQQQKAALRNIGAPDNYLTYLDEVSESQYWEVPFEQRGW